MSINLCFKRFSLVSKQLSANDLLNLNTGGIVRKLFGIILLNFLFSAAHADLTLYTDRPTARMQVVVDAFEKATGNKTTIVELKWDAMKAQLAQEGSSSPADVIFVKDLVYLNELAKDGRLQKMNSTVVNAKVDTSQRTDYWTAVTYRARTLVYESSLDVSGINTYEDLAKPEYASTLCLRTSTSAYNEALVAGMVNIYGYDKAKNVIDGWLNNRADQALIYKDDNAIIADVAAGKCAFGITNSYYLGLALMKNPSLPVAIKFLGFDANNGVHTNGTGAGVSATTKQAVLAQQFVEFLLSQEIQTFLSEQHQDFPANKDVGFPTFTKSWTGFKADSTNWSLLSTTVEDARKIFVELDYL
jgi:iron(III) transport system substrate-binding protein